MVRLVVKDLLLQKKMVLWSLGYIFFFQFAFKSMGSLQISPTMVAVSYMLLMSSCAWEDKNNSDIMLNSLPLSRAKIVAAKYLSMLVYGLLVIPAYWLVTTLMSLVGDTIKLAIYPLSSSGVIIGLATTVLMSALYLPIFFKVGYHRSRIINFVLFFGLFAVGSQIGDFLLTMPKPDWIDTLPDITQWSDATIPWLLLLAAIAIQLVSYGFALRFYRQREF